MRKYCLFMAVSAAIWSVSAARIAPSAAIRVATYNIRCPSDKGTPNEWEARRDDVANLVKTLDLDAFGLQEVTPEQMADLRARLPDFEFVGEYRNADRASGEASPVAYRKTRFTAEKSGTFWLSETPDTPGLKGWGARCPRVCSYLVLNDRRTGVRFCFANTHTDHVSALARKEGMLLVLRRMAEFGAGAPIVFTGDHNCRETEEPAQAVAKILTNALYATETPARGPWRTWNGWRWRAREIETAEALALPLAARNDASPQAAADACGVEDRPRDGSFYEKCGGPRIDYIYVSAGVRVLDYETVGEVRPKKMKQFYPSDHFPIAATILLPKTVEQAIRGPYPILSVPYREDGSVDLDVLVKEAEFVASCGVNGFIWAQSNDAIDLLTVAERKESFTALAKAFAGRAVNVALGCQGRNTTEMEELARHVESLADAYPTTRLVIASRPPHDARTQEDVERYYRALAKIARRPVIIQTYTSDKAPIPASDLLVRLAHEFPKIYGWIKEETGGIDANERMIAEVAAPEVKTVFSAWGGYGWLDQYRRFGTRGIVSERAAYADFVMRIWDALQEGDATLADDLFSRYLLMMNLKETVPGGHLRGFSLYVLKKRGIFKNFISREYADEAKTPGKWKLETRVFTPGEIAEIEDRFLRIEPYLKK